VDGAKPCSIAPPQVGALAPQTPHEKAALRGTAVGAVRVEASLGGKVFGVEVGPNGAFCLEVALPDVPQPVTFAVVAIAAAGCRSEAATVTTQRVRVEAKNVLAGLVPAATNAKDPLARLTDGLLAGPQVEFSFWDTTSECDTSALIRFELGQSVDLEKVIVHYGKTSSRYARCWKLFGATSIAAPPQQGWTLLAEDSNSKQKSKLEIKVGKQLRHLALRLYEDGGSGIYETFLLTEIEAWTSGDPPPFVGCK
jgi:hypothetical protein